MQRQSLSSTTESRPGLIRSIRAFESAKRNASGVLFEPCAPSAGGSSGGAHFRSGAGGHDSRTGRISGRTAAAVSPAGGRFRRSFAATSSSIAINKFGASGGKDKHHNHSQQQQQHNNNNNHWQNRCDDSAADQTPGRREKSYRYNGSEYNQNVNGSTEHLFSNKSLIESGTPLKSLRTILKQFDVIEKRQWPNFLHDLTLLFRKPAFVKVASEKTHRIVDDCTRIFARILTTKLFPDISDGMVQCLTALSSALKFGCKELFHWMFAFYEPASDETKHVLLKSLVRIMQSKGKGVSEQMTSIMSKLKAALEETESRILLLELTEIFVTISQSYPAVFQSHFCDVIDILIAWHLDSALDPTLTRRLTAAFSSFQKFWLSDLISSQTLLRNFIEDFELNTGHFRSQQNLPSGRADSSPVLMRMAALVQVYVTVFGSLGTDVMMTTDLISWDFVMLSMLTVLSTATDILKNHQMHEHLAIACNNCTIFTVEQVQSFGEEGMDFLTDSKDNMLHYLDCLMPYLPNGSVQFVVSTLRLQLVLVKCLSSNLPVDFVTKVMTNNHSLRLMPSEEIHSALYDLHHAMLSVKSLPQLGEAYRGLLLDLQTALSVLTGESLFLCDQSVSSGRDGHASAAVMTSRTAMIIAKSTLISLTELGNARGSLIGMWALKPTFFDLILTHLNPSSSAISRFSDLQFMILTMLLSHARKHRHFIASSAILRPVSKSGSSFTAMIEAPTCGHLSRILLLLYSVLKREKITLQNRLLCLEWTAEILSEAGVANILNLICRTEMIQLLEVVSTQSYAKNSAISLTSCSVLRLLITSVSLEQLPPGIRETYFDACLFQSVNFDQKVKEAFEQVLPLLGYKNETQREANLIVFNRDEMFYPEDVFMAKLSLMKREQNNSFSAVSFQRIMKFILNGSSEEEGFEWLQRILRSSINDGAPLKQPTLMFKTQGRFQSLFGSEQNIVKVFEANESALMFWAGWEVVSYCIANKLKTPLGKAQDLLTKIGLTFHQLASDDAGQSLQLVHVKMLLLLMENLDKQIHSAIDGSGLRISPVSKTAKTFFATNKGTCFDWLARNRLFVMQVAAKAWEPEVVWRNGIELIRELMNRNSHFEIEACLILVTEALIQLKDRDSIVGLMVWAKEKVGLTCAWMKSAIKEAAGKREIAVSGYEALLRDQKTEIPTVKSKIADFASRRLTEIYLNIGSYEEAIRWSHNNNWTGDLSEKLERLTVTNIGEWKDFQPFDMRAVYRLSVQKLTQVIRNEEQDAETALKLGSDVRECIKMTLASGSDSQLNKWLILNRLTEQVCQSSSECVPLDLVSGMTRDLDSSELMQVLSFCRFSHDFYLPSHLPQVLMAAESARRQENLTGASKLLFDLCGSGERRSLPTTRDPSPLVSLLQDISIATADRFSAVQQLQLVSEGCELLCSFGHTKPAVEILLRQLSPLSNSGVEELDVQLKALQSKSLLILAKHLEADAKLLEKTGEENWMKILPAVSELGSGDKVLVGKLLERACSLDPKSALCKQRFAIWTFNAAKQLNLEDVTDASVCPTDDLFVSHQCYRLSARHLFDLLQQKGDSSDDSLVSASLMLLRILTKHSGDSNDQLRDGLRLSPTAPWRMITIQLFAHLSHSEDEFVTELLSELLCRIGQETPHLIVFPAVSGSMPEESRVIDVIDAKVQHAEPDLLSNPDDPASGLVNGSDRETNGLDQTSRTGAYSAIVEILKSYNGQLITETMQFIREMRRIAVLWDELWIGTLQSRLNESKKKTVALEAEVQRLNSSSSALKRKSRNRLMKEMYDSAFGRIIDKLTQIKGLTVDVYPETPYEKWFQSTFGKVITSTIISLKNPDDYEKPQQVLSLLQQLLQSLQKRSLELATSKSQLVMDTISPTLSSFSATVVPVPGVKQTAVTISKVSRTVTILHTKTKPKKVCFHGSGGESHYFLFKGHEDLHLDERIMQFLEIVNKMFFKRGSPSGADCFKARFYSVTPLGSKSGLIEWVDGGPPLFGFYKRWLLNRQSGTAAPSAGGRAVEPLVKPSEIFSKMLLAKGLHPENRSSWPKDALLQIHNDLSRDTCDQLIARELWFSSTSTQEFYRLTKSFTRSNAVMAVIGYIIGLGDRHLDNILLDLSTGEIIHVDYNICFEKGKLLHVPEKVPCRLTKCIVSAFGLTGVEGTFRLSCEHVLSILRKEKDTLLLLLEAFICDPLIEWKSLSFEPELKSKFPA